MSSRELDTFGVSAVRARRLPDSALTASEVTRFDAFSRAVRVFAGAVLVFALMGIPKSPLVSLIIVGFALVRLASAPTQRGLVWLIGLSTALGLLHMDAGGGAIALSASVIAALAISRLSPDIVPIRWMDRALVAQSYPGRSMTTHHVLETRVPFERLALTRALAMLQAEVPVLRTLVREAPLGMARFVAAPASTVQWLQEPIELGELGWYQRPFDLAKEAPIRVLHAPRIGGGYQLVMTLHHSATDGMGAMILLDALMRHYDRARGIGIEPPQAIDRRDPGFASLLFHRGLLFAVKLAIRSAWRAPRFGTRSASLLERRDAVATETHALVMDISRERWSLLAGRARELGCTRNDLVLSAWLRAAADWRAARGMPEEPLTALVPMDLRGHIGAGGAMHNYFGALETEYDRDDIASPELARRVSERSRRERDPSRVLTTPLMLAALGRALPPAAFRALFRAVDQSRNAFRYSFLFSHIRVADGIHLPESTLSERLYCLSALPRQPGVGLTITALPLSVTFALAYTPPRLSHEGARELMSFFMARVDEL
jgi:hypothetical protein